MQVKVPFLGCDDSISSPAFSNASRCFLLQELFWSIQFQRRYEEAKGVAWGLPHRDVLHVCFQSLPPVLCKEDPLLRRKKRSICCIASLACLVFNTDASLGALVLPCILHLGSGSKSCKVWQFGYGKSTEPPTQGRMLLSLCSVSFSLCHVFLGDNPWAALGTAGILPHVSAEAMQLPGFQWGAARRERNGTWRSVHCSHLQPNPFVKGPSARLNKCPQVAVCDISAACGVRSEVEG